MTAAARKDIRNTRGLGLLLPIRPDDHVLVIGPEQAPLVASLARFGAAVTYIVDEGSSQVADVPPEVRVEPGGAGGALPLEDASADHVILVATQAGWCGNPVQEVARVCRPGANLAMLVPNRLHRRVEGSYDPRGLGEQLRARGFEVAQIYGVRERIADVRHLVPLGGAPATWYARHVALSPLPRPRALLMRLLAATGHPGLVSRLFPALAATARRAGATC